MALSPEGLAQLQGLALDGSSLSASSWVGGWWEWGAEWLELSCTSIPGADGDSN